MNAELLVSLFNYDAMKRREILAAMADCAEHITLVDTYAFTPSSYANCEWDGAVVTGWEGV